MFAYPDCVVSSAVIYAEWPEFHEFQFIRQHLKPDDIVVDVGANVGHVLLLLADKVGPDKLIAFEPTPVTFMRLQENWALNGWPADELHQCAVGAQAGEMLIPDTASPVTTNSLTSAGGDVRRVPVAVKALDEMGDWLGSGAVGLLKIDVEGFEPDVFRGGASFLKQRRPRLIMFESLTGGLHPEIASGLDAAGYKVFELDKTGAPDFTRATAQNLFAAAVDQVNVLSAKV